MSFNLFSRSSNNENKLSEITESLKGKIYSKEEIAEQLYLGLQYQFGNCEINIYLLDPTTLEIELTKAKDHIWLLPIGEKEWLINLNKEQSIKNKTKIKDFYYIENRQTSVYVDKYQLEKDQKKYDYLCQDGLYLLLISEEELILGIVFIQNWKNKKTLKEIPNFEKKLQISREFISNVAQALDNLMIHQKLESLVFDNQELKLQIQQDKARLKRRILELSVLYDISNSLSSSIDYKQIVTQVLDSLHRVQDCDVASIFLVDFITEGEIILQSYCQINNDHIDMIKANIISAITPFKKVIPNKNKIKIRKNYHPEAKEIVQEEPIRSFANVPLIFKEKIIGILSIYSMSKNAFTRNEITFLHTLANQLALLLGRVKVVKEVEKSKIGSLIQSMSEAIIMVDESHNLEIINPVAKNYLNLKNENKISNTEMRSFFKELGLTPYQINPKQEYKPILNKLCCFKDKMLSINITPVLDIDKKLVGTVFVLTDVTEIQKINRIKTQRLEVISKVSLLLNSIADLNNLLAILMEFILNLAEAEMGSIQLIQGNEIRTKVHSNFPDKILRRYKLISGETISNYVMKKKQICIIWEYMKNKDVMPTDKILVDCYVCLPLIVKNNLIGIVNIVRKLNPNRPKLNYDDIKTLLTIASLAGTAIHNANLYNETLKRNTYDQEIKIASEIQSRLLPEKVPKLNKFQFGAISIPSRGIGGDYYDFFELKNGNIGIIVADIIGKGIPAGLFMAMLKSLLHRYIPEYNSTQKALDFINKIVYKDSVFEKFVPLFFGILNPKDNCFQYCNAGHEPAIIFSENKFATLDTKGFPLGAYLESDYEEKEIVLKDQDIVLIFTDGVVEAKDEKGKIFGQEQLQSFVKKHKLLTPEKIVTQIYNYMSTKQKMNTQHDDLTLIALKATFQQKKQFQEKPPLKIKKMRITSSKKNIKIVRKEIDRLGEEMSLNESDVFNLKLAINEAQANIIEHVYMGKEDKEIYIQFNLYDDRIEILMKDFGKGITQSTIKEGKKHLDILEGSGLGLFLIKSVMDDIKYNRIPNVGTELWLTKYLQGKES